MKDGFVIKKFSNALRGRVILPGEPDYEGARAVWNGMIDRRPALIVCCSGAADVRTSVNFAREHGLPLTVKAGGHNVAGNAICDDGLVIDLSAMNSVHVNPTSQTAHVGPGATWADFDREAQSFGLATTGGVDSRTGVGGLTLGGGIGYLARRFGLSIDNLLSVDVVTADGELRQADEKTNKDLFWALRGGGRFFGVVTSFVFQLHEVGPDVLTAQIFHPFSEARNVLRFYREFTAEAPNELACYAMVVHVPPVDPFPEAFRGQIALAIVVCYSGSIPEGEELLIPLQTFGVPILSAVQPMPYTSLQQSFDAGTPDGQRYHYKSQYLNQFSDEIIDVIVNEVEPLPGDYTIIGIEPMGGAISDVSVTSTAYPHRNAAYNFSVWAGWSNPEDDDEIISWARRIHREVNPYSTGGTYPNYLDRDDPLAKAYGANYERLLQLKKAWDPDNVFRPYPDKASGNYLVGRL